MQFGKLSDEQWAFIKPLRPQELVEALEAVGVKRNVATIIVYLKDMDEATSRDIEKGSELRQPEVSIAMRTLREKGWIAERDVKGSGKGRPTRLYRLIMSIDEIIVRRGETQRVVSGYAVYPEAERDICNLIKRLHLLQSFLHPGSTPPRLRPGLSSGISSQSRSLWWQRSSSGSVHTWRTWEA